MPELCSLTDLATRFGWRNYLGEPDPEVVGRVIEHEYLLGNLPVGRRDYYVVGSPELNAITRMFVQLERSLDRVDEDRPRRRRKRRKGRRIIMATAEAATRKSKGKRKAKGVQEGEVVTPTVTRRPPENMVTIQDLATEFGYQPQYLRKLLRDAREAGDFEHAPRTRYQWERDSAELDAVRDLIQRHVDDVTAAKASAEDEDIDSDEE